MTCRIPRDAVVAPWSVVVTVIADQWEYYVDRPVEQELLEQVPAYLKQLPVGSRTRVLLA